MLPGAWSVHRGGHSAVGKVFACFLLECLLVQDGLSLVKSMTLKLSAWEFGTLSVSKFLMMRCFIFFRSDGIESRVAQGIVACHCCSEGGSLTERLRNIWF